MSEIFGWAASGPQPEPITVEIWRELPEEFCRQVEVVNGMAVRCASPTPAHQAALFRLQQMFDTAAEEYNQTHDDCVDTKGDVDLLLWQVPMTIRRPDILLHECLADHPRPIPASSARLVVEIVSPGSDRTDRFDKMAEYAGARIPFYWIVWISGNHVSSIDVHSLEAATGAYRHLRTLGPEDEVSVLEVPIRIRIHWNRLAVLERE